MKRTELAAIFFLMVVCTVGGLLGGYNIGLRKARETTTANAGQDKYLKQVFGPDYLRSKTALVTYVCDDPKYSGPLYVQDKGVWVLEDNYKIETLRINGPDGTPLRTIEFNRGGAAFRQTLYDADGTTVVQTLDDGSKWTSKVQSAGYDGPPFKVVQGKSN